VGDLDFKTEILSRIKILESELDESLHYALSCTSFMYEMVEKDHSIFAAEPWHRLTDLDSDFRASELLLRLTNSKGEALPPYDFVMACYQNNLTALLDMIIILCGLREFTTVFRHREDRQVSLNVSARFLEPRNRNNIQDLLKIIETLDLDGDFIFELHESAFHTDIAPSIMELFYRQGVRFAIDDVTLNVGDIIRMAGFREFIDFIKLDRTFVESHDEDPERFSDMVDFVCNHAPKSQIVAEAVKSAEHAYRLRQAHEGILYVQGRDLPERDAFQSDWVALI